MRLRTRRLTLNDMHFPYVFLLLLLLLFIFLGIVFYPMY